ncbi:hypothetical protein BOMU111920_01495 [Bordetella muralis]|jgi:hypothetical protein
MVIERSAQASNRTGLSNKQLWHGEDGGLIACWERGKELAREQPNLAERARKGELVVLPWKGGVEAAIKGRKYGSHRYLAMWQGLRGDDLHIHPDSEVEMSCPVHKAKVIFVNDVDLLDTLPD